MSFPASFTNVAKEPVGVLCYVSRQPKVQRLPLWLAEDHHARLSSVFAPHLGHPRSEDLDSEYLNIFETRTRTPFFQDVYVDGVRVMLIIGPTGTGKSVHGKTHR
jgi:type IV secretion system protein VirB4